jgi:hypothetical protein
MKRRFIVTFGRKQPDAALLQRFVAYRQATDMTGIAAFETGATPPFRLCDDDGRRFPPSFLADLPDTARKLARLKADTSRDFDLFAKNPRRLLDIYFDFIAVRLAAEAPALELQLRPLGGLFRVEDWAFSALRPMPNAAVFDADDPEAAAPILLHDLAFWTGEAVLTIRLRGSGTPSPREAAACGRLQALGVQIVTIPVPELATGIALFSPERFPAAFRSFWQGAPYPCSPFRPQGLTRTLVLD